MYRHGILLAALGALAAHACTLDFEQYRDPAAGAGGPGMGAGGNTGATGGTPSTGGGSVGGSGGAGGGTGGGGGTPDLTGLGEPCQDNSECIIGECCMDNACDNTCMVPCDNDFECPIDTMGCLHGYCLFSCDVDDDCEHDNYICHHNCQWCEKKSSQDCGD